MSKMVRPLTEGFVFGDVQEYFAYRGINDGYYANVEDPMEVIESFFGKSIEIRECYLLGFYLGQELRSEILGGPSANGT